jgi:hypothetical protein
MRDIIAAHHRTKDAEFITDSLAKYAASAVVAFFDHLSSAAAFNHKAP